MNRTITIFGQQVFGIMELLVSYLPGPIGVRMRYFYWKKRLRKIGKNVVFGVGVRITRPDWVSIGNSCWIDDYVSIIAGKLNDDGKYIARKHNNAYKYSEGEVVIKNNVHIAPYVLIQGHGGVFIGESLTIASGAKIYSLTHHYCDLTGLGSKGVIWKFVGSVAANEQALICSPVVIGNNGAVGVNSVILPGSTIGENSWLGAMSLLKGELPAGVIAAGNPARIMKRRPN